MPYSNIDLCGLWRFQPDPSEEGEKIGYFDPEYDIKLWREVQIPCDFESCMPNLDTYEGMGWFRKNIIISSEWKNKRIVLHFEGVNYHAKVWVNGKFVGENLDGFLPFDFSIGNIVRFGEKNVIVVKVDNIRKQGEVPGLQRGWRTFGGILREVSLISTNFTYIDQANITTEPLGKGWNISLNCDLLNENNHDVSVEVAVQITGVLNHLSQPIVIDGNNIANFSFEDQIEKVNAWSPDSPNLYNAKVELIIDGQIISEKTICFGFRKIEAKNGKLLLNGEPIYLVGFNRHEDSPHKNMTTDMEIARRDLLDMKEAGANFVRLCHYPHHPRELDLCDEIGLLVMDEIPLYWWDGNNEGEENCQKKLESAKRQLEKMIQRDINHPSVIFWSVSNETQEERPEVAEGNRQLIRLAKELDPTRLSVHVSDHWKQYPNFSEDDVICVNGYPSLDRRGYNGEIGYDLSESTRFWQKGLLELNRQYPDKPILVTEFGYASFDGIYNNGFGEDMQSLAIESEFRGMSASYICGATVWCWADHPWPQAYFSFCKYLGISPYGVVTRDRKKLKAYWTIRSLFYENQGRNKPKREISIETPAGYEVTMVRDNMLNIPYVNFPDGFGIRPMKLDDASLWTDIVRDAEDYIEIKDDLFYKTSFGYDMQAIQWRGFIITNSKGLGVGTITAWYNRGYKGKDYGNINWVAIRPAYQGKGLGKAALSYALNKLAKWHDRCFLVTQTKRLNAIKLYLNFGFMPELEVPEDNDIWREVKYNLKHPTLEKYIL